MPSKSSLLAATLLFTFHCAYASSTVEFTDAETFALSTFVVRGAAVALTAQSDTAHELATKDGLETVILKHLLLTFRVDDWLMGSPSEATEITLTVPLGESADPGASKNLALLLQGADVVLPITAVPFEGKQGTYVVTFSRVYPLDTKMHLDHLSSILVEAETIRASRAARKIAQSQPEQP